MRTISVEKITLNVGAGKDQAVLEKGLKLLKHITGIAPVKTFTQKRIPTWGLRPGLPIGCKLTIRGAQKYDLLRRFLKAKDNKLKPHQFDAQGNLAFGVPEYIDIPGVKYDPEIGMMGLEICVTLKRPGFRVKHRKIRKRVVSPRHRITPQESMSFMQQTFNLEVDTV